MENEKNLKVTVTLEQTGQRLDKLLGTLDPIGSRSRGLALIESGHVLVNLKAAKPSYEVSVGDIISITYPIRHDSENLVPLNLPLDIAYEDQDLLVVNKPAGLVVHPAAGHAQDTLVNALLHHTKDLSVGFGEKRPGIVHRLDRDTSGLIAVAKTDLAQHSLSQQFREKTAHRVYWALIYGSPKSKTGTLSSLLLRHPTDRKRFASHKTQGKKAITHYEVRQTGSQGVSLIRLKLETGRTHQIRVHLSELGHPILGDNLYGAASRTKNLKSNELRELILMTKRFALHAAELGFCHPRSGEPMFFSVPWPKDLQPILRFLNFISQGEA